MRTVAGRGLPGRVEENNDFRTLSDFILWERYVREGQIATNASVFPVPLSLVHHLVCFLRRFLAALHTLSPTVHSFYLRHAELSLGRGCSLNSSREGPHLYRVLFKFNPQRSLLTPRQVFADSSIWGWGVHAEDFPYDNRPEAPLQQYTFEQWWFVSVDHSIESRLFWILIAIPAVSTGTWPIPLLPVSSSSSPPVAPPSLSWLATRALPSGGLIPTDTPTFVREITLARITRFPNSM